MTDAEIVKALECCSTASCISNKCHYEKIHDIPTCTTKLTKDALDLINRLQAEKQDLEIELQAMRGAANSYKAKIKKLRYNLEAVLDERADHSEAYKEFAERLKKKYKPYVILGSGVAEIEIDNLLKEMVGDE